LNVVEIGGGLSGLQFVFDRYGCRVTNVDPGTDASGRDWELPECRFAHFNQLFRAGVHLISKPFSESGLPAESADRLVAISVLEHLSQEECGATFLEAARCLKEGALFVLTVDLFLDIQPFSESRTNVFGENIDIYRLVRDSPFELIGGNPAELCGFPEFRPQWVQENVDRFLVGSYPALAQCLVLRKVGRRQTYG
jgi:hypothetical protein